MKIILWIVTVIYTGLYICTSVKDPDLWWHITIGRWIIANRSVPSVDYWTMFGSGMPWKAYSWSTEILFALVDKWFAIPGLFVLQCVLAIVLATALCWGLSRIAGDYFFGTLAGIYASVACFSHFTLRPQVLVWVYFVLLIVVADTVSRQGLNRANKFALFALMALWANTHLSAILGMLMLAGWIFKGSNWREVLTALACCFVGTLFTPYLGGEWIMFVQTTSHPFSHQSIYEFQPANITQYVTAFLIIGIAILAVFFHEQPQKFPPARLIMLGIFVIGGLAVVKFMPFAVIVVAAVIAAYWRTVHERSVGEENNLVQAFERLRILFSKIEGPGLVFLIACLAFWKIFPLWQNPIDRQVTPVAAVDFILKKNLPHPLLNPFGSGGYLLYRMSNSAGEPQHKVAIDGRTNIISEDLWGAFYVALNGRAGWQKFIEMVQPNTILWKWESPLTSILLEGGKWCSVFRSGTVSDGFVVFLKKEYFSAHRVDLSTVRCE